MRRAVSIKLRITLFLIAAIVLTLGTATWLLDAHIDDEVAKQADTNLLERAQALSDIFNLRTTGSLQTFGPHHVPDFLADDGIFYFNIACQGQQIRSSSAAASLAWPASTPGRPGFANRFDSIGTELRAVSIQFQPSPVKNAGLDNDSAVSRAAGRLSSASVCSLGLAVDLKPVRTFQNSMDRIEYGCILAALFIVIMLTPLLIRRGLRPLSQLAEAVRLIGPESPERRLNTDSAPELQPLIIRFNEVLSRMEEGLTRERQFASGVAHELRTPLAEMRTMIEVELRYPSGRDPHTFLADVGMVGREMERLVTALLLLTRIEAGIELTHYQTVDIGALTRKLLDRHQDEMKGRRLDLHVLAQEPLAWEADPTLLEVVLGNLLGNAVTYAPIGTALLLSFQSNTWSLINDAPGLDAEDVEQMHRRFWRKGRDAGVHAGLGVALAGAAARAQSMHLSLSLKNGQMHATVGTDRTTSSAAFNEVPVLKTPPSENMPLHS